MSSLLKHYRWHVAVAAIVASAVVLVWFQPQTLFFDTVVEEDLPGLATGSVTDDGAQRAADATSAPDDDATDAAPIGAEPDAPTGDSTEAATDPVDEEAEPTPPPGPIELASGTFGSLGRYTTTGTARLIELEDGERYLRLEEFETTNGPDLFVYLSTGAADGSTGFTAEFVDLGVLRGNIGDQNYLIPADVEVDRFPTVVIYCKRFSSPFGAAALMAA